MNAGFSEMVSPKSTGIIAGERGAGGNTGPIFFGSALADEQAGKFDMGGPAELADRTKFLQLKPRLHQQGRVTRPAGGIAADIDHAAHAAFGNPLHLFARTGWDKAAMWMSYVAGPYMESHAHQDQGAFTLEQASWQAIRSWAQANPARVGEMMAANPRVVFFREEALPAGDIPGPKGAQGVPLTAGRSIAVDPGSIPYGTPVWMASNGPQTSLQRLVLAQDTGTAITGAVRADYYAGSGPEAGELAGRLKQPLRLWVLWPR